MVHFVRLCKNSVLYNTDKAKRSENSALESKRKILNRLIESASQICDFFLLISIRKLLRQYYCIWATVCKDIQQSFYTFHYEKRLHTIKRKWYNPKTYTLHEFADKLSTSFENEWLLMVSVSKKVGLSWLKLLNFN